VTPKAAAPEVPAPASEKPQHLPENPRVLPAREPTAPPERSLSDPAPRPSASEATPALRDVGETPEPDVAQPVRSTTNDPDVPTPRVVPAVGGEKSQALAGRLELWRKTWRLRYASVDTEDAHGGRVTLLGGPSVEELREGQRIRVRGILIPSPDRAAAPTFHVQSFEVLN
jgi:hypothetical protein